MKTSPAQTPTERGRYLHVNSNIHFVIMKVHDGKTNKALSETPRRYAPDIERGNQNDNNEQRQCCNADLMLWGSTRDIGCSVNDEPSPTQSMMVRMIGFDD